ncbi:MAG: hypothetical protein HQK96_07445, partial [Nitrospirae bacterium]|nr:hypothetical protein [Nitrospirota bacterium]
GGTTGAFAPIQIGTSTNWSSVSSGYTHTAGIKNDGTLWTWGYNVVGQLGNGTNTDSLIPVQIGTSTWSSVSASALHTVGIKRDGTLWAWGYNSNGQLGDGTTTNRNLPVQIGTSTWSSVSAGNGYTMGVKSDGTLWAWGGNSSGRLGDGTTTDENSPVQIGTSNWIISPPSSSYTLSVTKTGTGTGTVTPSSGTLIWSGSTGTAVYTSGTSVVLTATAASGSIFSSWSGCDATSGQYCAIAMSSNKSVTATFTSSGGSSDYNAASAEITTIYNQYASFFGTKSGSIVTGTSGSATYYVQWFTNGAALVAWTDGTMYTFYNNTWYALGVNWK